MPRIAYVNGRYQPLAYPAVAVEDRAFQFADGVYEVYEVRGGRLVDERRHFARLQRSLGELRIREPMAFGALGAVLREVLRRNRTGDGLLYLQVSRGVAPRNHPFPPASVRPGIVVTARPFDMTAADRRAVDGVSVITVPDIRWKRVDIKSVSLLPNVLAKQAAREADAWEAWFVDGDGVVSEGSSSNAWIADRNGALITAPTDSPILRGITRTVVIDTARVLGYTLAERPFTLDEAFAAREAFMTSATSLVTPITRIDGRPVGEGRPGLVAAALRAGLKQNATLAPVLPEPVAQDNLLG